jgi:hypothetical protein
MKRILILSMAAFLILGFTSIATAYLINNPAYVQFYSHDDSGDKLASINILGNASNLWFNLDNTGWVSTSSNTIIPIGTIDRFGKALVGFAIGPNISNLTYSASAMEFLGPNASFPGHYDTLVVNWDSTLYSKFEVVGNTNGTDNVSPVPLPGAALLLGAGLVGLVGVRRRIMS